MSHRRETYDGDFTGRNPGFTEWRDPIDSKNTISVNASSKKSSRNARHLIIEDDISHEESDKDRYLITYADLITLLLGLFIILYAISNIDSKKYQNFISAIGSTFGSSRIINTSAVSSKEISPLHNLKSDFESIIRRYGYDKVIGVEENERGVTIHILEDIIFKSGSADLNENSLEILGRLASILKMLPNDIRIEGHTDNVPINTASFPSNWHLSVSRALNTAYHLITQEKLSADKISIVGYAEFKPLASNESEQGRKLNRRVDLVIIKK
jgi:chemotaxis protein MotB